MFESRGNHPHATSSLFKPVQECPEVQGGHGGAEPRSALQELKGFASGGLKLRFEKPEALARPGSTERKAKAGKSCLALDFGVYACIWGERQHYMQHFAALRRSSNVLS